MVPGPTGVERAPPSAQLDDLAETFQPASQLTDFLLEYPIKMKTLSAKSFQATLGLIPQFYWIFAWI